jgi:hypothetical protein
LIADIGHNDRSGSNPAVSADSYGSGGLIHRMRQTAVPVTGVLLAARNLDVRSDLRPGADICFGDDAVASNGDVRRKPDAASRKKGSEPDINVDRAVSQCQSVEGGTQEISGNAREHGHAVRKQVE